MYKAKDIDEFEQKIKNFFNGKLKSLVNNYKKVVDERDLKNIGKQLKEVYEYVINQK